MAFGNLKFDTLTTSDAINTNTEKSLDTSYVFNGVPKSWNQCVGTGDTINDSFNVGSITDTATGRININLTNNMSNDDYSMVGSQGDDGRAQNCYSPSTSEYEAMTTLTSNQNAVDVALNCSSILGDLA